MSIIKGIHSILPADVAESCVAGNLPDKPSREGLYSEALWTPDEVKAAYDRLPKLIVSYYNALIESIGGVTGEELDEDSLASKILTGLREGHSLRDLFLDIKDGNFAAYLSLGGEETLLSYLEKLLIEGVQVGEDEPSSATPGKVGGLYFATSSATLFICVASEADGRLWRQLSFGLATTEKDGLMASGDKASLETMKEQIADLLYKAMAITSFENSVKTAEMGSTVDEVTLSWLLNKTPSSLTLDGESLDTAASSAELSALGLNENKTWTLVASDERGAVATAKSSLVFYNGIYYGAASEADVTSLTKVLSGTKGRSFTANAGEGAYIWYILPSRLGSCAFKVGGFDGGFSLYATKDFTNDAGYTEEYAFYRSDNASLGETTVTVS